MCIRNHLFESFEVDIPSSNFGHQDLPSNQLIALHAILTNESFSLHQAGLDQLIVRSTMLIPIS